MRKAIALFTLLCIVIIGSSFSAGKPAAMEKMMKQMLNYIRLEKKQVETNQPAQPFPVDEKQLKSAKVHGKKPSTEHNMYMDDFFLRLNEYQQAKDSIARRTTYNAMVNTCVNCHRHECPGPVKVIEKSLF